VIAENGVGSNSLTLIGVSNLASVQNFSFVDLQMSQVTVPGGVSIVDGGTLATTIFGPGGTLGAPSTNVGNITGTLTFQGAGTIMPTMASIVHNGDVFQVASDVSIASGLTVDNTALVTFTPNTQTGPGPLLLTAGVLSPTQIPGLSNAGGAALNALLSYTGNDPGLQGLGAVIENLTSPDDVRSAGEQLRPEVNGASIMVPIEISRTFQSQIDTRLDSAWYGSHTGYASEAIGYADMPTKARGLVPSYDSTSGATFWGNLVGANYDQRAIGPIAGYTATADGVVGGVDTLVSNSIRVGGAFGYATSAISDDPVVGNNTGIETYQGMIYGSIAPFWYLNGSLGFAWEDYTTSRRIVIPAPPNTVFNDVANATHAGQLYLGRVDAGYPIPFGRFTVVPVASFDWDHLDQDGYSESSMLGSGLTVSATHNDSIRSELGVKTFTPIASGPSFTATVGAHVEWMHEYGDLTQALTAGFVGGGATFLAVGPTPDRDMVDVGADLQLARLFSGQSLTFSYSALVGPTFVEQTAMLRARMDFNWGLDDYKGGPASQRQAWNLGSPWAALGFSDSEPTLADRGTSSSRSASQSSQWAQIKLPNGLYDQAGSPDLTLPEIHVIGTTPVPPVRRVYPSSTVGGGVAVETAQTVTAPVPGAVDRDKIPSNVQTLSAPDFDHATVPNFLDALERGLPGVSLSDETGNQFQLDLDYRGFTASPVPGTSQGIAVYQNGVRINEVFGDIVNWDLIPEDAIAGLTLVPSNPVYGLNAIGGALSLEMKNGFTYHGVEGEVSGGSYGRVGATVQAGGQNGNLSGYITADAIHDEGWRLDSPSDLRRVYVDLGAQGDKTEFHVSFTGADNNFGVAAATPGQLLAQNWSSIYTVPQSTQNQLAFLTASASWKPSDTWTYQANAYFRHYQESHVDGNGTDACSSTFCPDTGNDPTTCPDATVLCFPTVSGTPPYENLTTTTGNTVPATGTLGTSVLGEIDRTWTTTNSFGGSVQAATTDRIFGHDNNFTIGASIDRGLVQFSTTSELGTINANTFPAVVGFGIFIDQPDGDVAPVGLGAETLYTGLYATDTFDVGNRLSVTGGGRFNYAQVNLQDELGTDSGLTGNHNFERFNPMIGLTYKLTPNTTVYGSYSEANRAPTPLELECSDPTRPCLIDNALVADPSLKQVVSHTFEAGIRGHLDVGKGLLNWTLSAFHTLNTDDIINTASSIVVGHEFFTNAGDTLRRGVEADLSYKWDRWTAYANYTYIDATFQSAITLASENNPFADANGNIFVVPGDHLTGIPDFRFKAGLDYQVTTPWKVGADLNVIGSQWLVGDESNQNAKLPAYWTVNFHTSYQVTKNIQVFGTVKNLFDQHYYTFGTFADIDSFPYLNLTDPRTYLPGMPFAAYVGVRGSL
jgi:iron complex outermembrane recepter protein